MPAAVHPVIRVALFLAGYLLVLFATSIFKGMAPLRYGDVVWGLASSLGLVALTWVFLRRERRDFADVGMEPDRATVVRLFGAVAMRLGGLALAIGVHAGVNFAQWMVSEKGTPGVWTIGADPAATAQLANAPWVATSVMLLATVAVWLWPRAPTRMRRRACESRRVVRT